MNKTAFNKLKAGDRVSVTGKQDSKAFKNDTGRIIEDDKSHYYVAVMFDAWKEGHGANDDQWNFYDTDTRKFDITVIPEEPKVVEAKPAITKPKKRPHGAQEYKGNGKHAWEKVTGNTVRLRVPGGWLYGKHNSYSDDPTRDVMAQTTFVPVPSAVGYAV